MDTNKETMPELKLNEINVPSTSTKRNKPSTPTPMPTPDTGTVDLGILLKFIKPFDGSRHKLNAFISNCESADELANKNQKPILLKYIISQLEGTAETTVSIKEFDNLPQFLEFLKNHFGEKKHYSYLLAELQDCKQGPNENVNCFALRVETILAKLKSEINLCAKKKSESSGRVAAMEDLALHTFVIGLQPRLSQMVRCRDPENLNTAIAIAVAEEKIIASFKKQTNPQIGYERPRYPATRQNFSPRLSLAQHTNRPTSSPQNAVVCRYCKFPGHTIENCRKRQYNNNMRQGQFNNNSDRRFQTPSSNPERAVARITPPRNTFYVEENSEENESDNLNA